MSVVGGSLVGFFSLSGKSLRSGVCCGGSVVGSVGVSVSVICGLHGCSLNFVRSSAGINYFTAQHTTFFLSVPTSTKPTKQPY